MKQYRIFINCLCFIMLLMTSEAFAEVPMLVERQGVYYPVNSQKPYTGSQKTFHYNKKLKRIMSFKNGVLTGAYIRYHLNGQLEQEGNYKNGKLEGDYSWYFMNGQLKQKSLFKNGLINGMTSFFRKNGTLESRKQYVAGNLRGRMESYHENGKLHEVWEDARMTILGLPFPHQGEAIIFSPSGEVLSRRYYLDGKEVEDDPHDW